MASFAQLELTIVSPVDPGWDDARRAWNLAVDQHSAAVALPEAAADAVAADNGAFPEVAAPYLLLTVGMAPDQQAKAADRAGRRSPETPGSFRFRQPS
jgi:hypothetical protein